MIYNSFKQLILPLLRESMPSYLLDKWSREKPTILLSEIVWSSPITITRNGWTPLKNFEGQATILLYSDKNKQLDPFPFIEKIINPLKKQLNDSLPTDSLDCEYQWYFYLQREFFNNITYEIQLEGQLEGYLFKKQ